MTKMNFVGPLPKRTLRIRNLKGFSLIEVVLYSGILAVLILVLSELSLASIDSYRVAKIKEDLVVSADQVLNTFLQEAKNAKRIYLPTTILNSDFSELSLETTFQPTDNTEPVTYSDIYWASGQIWLKRENQNPQPLTSANVEVKKFYLVRYYNGSFEGVKVYLNLESKLKPQEKISLSTFAFLRGGYVQ